MNIRKLNRKTAGFIAIAVASMFVFSAVHTVAGQEEKIPREQCFVWGANVQGPTKTNNPLDPQLGTGYQHPPIYEPLAWVDPIHGEFVPCLAEDWGWVDGHTFEIKIQPEAHFRKGQPVTAEDVAFSMKTLADPDYSGRLTAAYNEMVASLEVVDEKTLRIHVKSGLPERYGKVTTLLMEPPSGPYVFQKERWSELIDEYGKDIRDYRNMDPEKINGSGPYNFLSSSSEVSYFKRTDSYWANAIGRFFAPKYYKVPWFGSGEIILRAFGRGTIDIGQTTGVDQNWYKKRKQPDGNLWSWNPEGSPPEWRDFEPSDFLLIMNPEKEIFRHRWMRKALAYAMNYDKLVEVGGTAEIGWPSPPYYLNTKLPWDEYYNPDIVKEYFETETTAGFTHIKYDPQKAIEILQEHCEGSVDEGWTHNGKKLGPWKVLGWQGPSDVMSCTEVMAKSLEDIGIPASPDLPTYGTWDEKCRNFEFDLRWGLNGVPGFPKPIAGTYDEYFLQPGTTWTGSKMNYWKYWTENYPLTENTADEVREIVNELWVTPSGTDKSFELARELQEIVIPQLPVIPTYQKASPLCPAVNQWVNYPYKDDPLDWFTKFSGVFYSAMRHVYPKKVETTEFSLSPGAAEVGETVTARVTLKNTGDVSHKYPVYIHKGKADPGLSVKNRIAWKDPIVPANGTKTVTLEFAIEEPGSYTITVDDWRYSKWDPGDPIEKTLIVTKKEEVGPPIPENLPEKVDMAIKTAQDAKNAALSAKDTAQEAVNTAEAAKNAAVDAKTAAQEAKAAAEEAGGVSTSMLVASMVITIIVVLAGVYVITGKRAT